MKLLLVESCPDRAKHLALTKMTSETSFADGHFCRYPSSLDLQKTTAVDLLSLGLQTTTGIELLSFGLQATTGVEEPRQSMTPFLECREQVWSTSPSRQ